MKNFRKNFGKHPCLNLFFTKRMKSLSRPYDVMMYGKLGVEFFSTSELLYPKLKYWLGIITARPNFNMISKNHFVSIGIFDCSLYTRRIALKDNYHNKILDTLAETPVEISYLDPLAIFFLISAGQNQFIEEKIFNKASVRRIDTAFNTNSAFTGLYIENPFWHQNFDLRQNIKLKGRQKMIDLNAANICRLYVTTMKAMNFEEDIPSITLEKFKDHYVLVFGLNSMQDATENCHYPELAEELLRLESNFTFPLEHVAQLSVSGYECFWL